MKLLDFLIHDAFYSEYFVIAIAVVLTVISIPFIIIYFIIKCIKDLRKEDGEFLATHSKNEIESKLNKRYEDLEDLKQKRLSDFKKGEDPTTYDVLIESCKLDIKIYEKQLNKFK